MLCRTTLRGLRNEQTGERSLETLRDQRVK